MLTDFAKKIAKITKKKKAAKMQENLHASQAFQHQGTGHF